MIKNFKIGVDDSHELAYTNPSEKNITNDRYATLQEGRMRMPLAMAETGKPYIIQRIGGKEETRKFIENLGFVVGGEVTVISEIDGNLIVNVKGSRVAIGKDMATKIMV